MSAAPQPLPPFKGLPVRLGEREYLMPKLSFGGWIECNERLRAISEQQITAPLELQAAFIEVLLLAFRRNYPGFERRELEDALDWDSAPELFQRLLAYSVPQASGELTAAGNPSGPSTGEAPSPSA